MIKGKIKTKMGSTLNPPIEFWIWLTAQENGKDKLSIFTSVSPTQIQAQKNLHSKSDNDLQIAAMILPAYTIDAKNIINSNDFRKSYHEAMIQELSKNKDLGDLEIVMDFIKTEEQK